MLLHLKLDMIPVNQLLDMEVNIHQDQVQNLMFQHPLVNLNQLMNTELVLQHLQENLNQVLLQAHKIHMSQAHHHLLHIILMILVFQLLLQLQQVKLNQVLLQAHKIHMSQAHQHLQVNKRLQLIIQIQMLLIQKHRTLRQELELNLNFDCCTLLLLID